MSTEIKKKPHVRILGTRGVPAQHGGFETFAQELAPYLAKKGWDVTVYCQNEGKGQAWEDSWKSVRLIHIPVTQPGALGTIVFDWKSTMHALKEKGVVLTLGYNTAIFCLMYRLKGLKNIINMDGIEWKREKWSFAERAWLFLNERIATICGNWLIADHPEIMRHHLSYITKNKISVIPYGAERVENACADALGSYNLEQYQYCIVIARPEPENSILEIVKAFSKVQRGLKLVVLGNYNVGNKYHQSVRDAASDEVVFLGAIYDAAIVARLRFFAAFYVHGHTVGGTNPSLVEALGAGMAVIAHGNSFNQWVGGEGAEYFSSEEELSLLFKDLLLDKEKANDMRLASVRQFQKNFTWDNVLKQYENIIRAQIN